jgi:serine/threonine-protein kinase
LFLSLKLDWQNSMASAMTSELLKDRYQTIRELGSGGFGKTYLAEDTHMPSRRKCVIKQLKAVNDNPQIYKLVQQRFEREAALLEDLGDRHHQIPRLYAYFTEDEGFYLVEEWIEGQTLNQKVKQEGTLSENTVKELLRSLLPVLEYIQTRGIIHRDIKPENIILRSSDQQPVLIDFGSVKETMATVVTASGNSERSIIAGTPGFMASEQCAGRPVFASDLYGLGLTAIYLLTSKLPSELETDLHTGEIRWRHSAPWISQNFAAFLDKAVLPNARDRYINAKVMLEALQALPQSAPDTIITASQTSLQEEKNDSDNVPPTIITSAGNLPNSASDDVAQTTLPTVIPSNNDSATTDTPLTRLDLPPATVGGGGTFNESIVVPPEIDKWNWGAFLLSPLWPFTNQVWIGLLSWVPIANVAMPFILGAKGNAWAWKSRTWKSVEDFRAHQRAWAIAGSVVLGSSLVLSTVVVVLALALLQNSSTVTITNNPDNNTESQQQSTDSTSPAPISPNSLNTPPVVNVGGGNTEQAIEPNAFIDGYWRLDFSVGTTAHQSILYMKGVNGEMVTEYYDANTQKTEQVIQTMRLWSCSLGLIVKGYNPLDNETKQPHATYQPDEILLQQKPDGTLYADNCSGGVCSKVRVQYLGETLEQNK